MRVGPVPAHLRATGLPALRQRAQQMSFAGARWPPQKHRRRRPRQLQQMLHGQLVAAGQKVFKGKERLGADRKWNLLQERFIP